MAFGNTILVSVNADGKFFEGIISGTPKPGTLMTRTTAAPVNGVFTYEVVQRASGAIGPVYVLLGDKLKGMIEVGAALSPGGHTPGDSYADGDRGFFYAPQAGDELNLIVASVSGTADDVARAALFGVQTATGKLIANSSYASAPFQSNEVITDPTADYLLWVTYLGNQA